MKVCVSPSEIPPPAVLASYIVETSNSFDYYSSFDMAYPPTATSRSEAVHPKSRHLNNPKMQTRGFKKTPAIQSLLTLELRSWLGYSKDYSTGRQEDASRKEIE
jgi:hypothetical protein